MKKIDNKQIYISTQNLINNYHILKKRIGSSTIMSVIKGDAYGHGMQQCSHLLKKNGCNHFAISTLLFHPFKFGHFYINHIHYFIFSPEQNQDLIYFLAFF